jgi:hypothetical protein
MALMKYYFEWDLCLWKLPKNSNLTVRTSYKSGSQILLLHQLVTGDFLSFLLDARCVTPARVNDFETGAHEI